MKIKRKFVFLTLLFALFLCSCGQQDGPDYSYDGMYYESSENYSYEPEKEYLCAIDLIGEPISDIRDSGFDYDLIMNLTEYDFETAKPYAILIDGSYAFAAAVICKDDAVIAGSVETSITMNEIENFDTSLLGWSEAFNGCFSSHTLSMQDGRQYFLRRVWRSPDPSDILSVNTNAQNDCAFIYQDSYVYLPDYDFMWFHWGDSIYDVQSAMIDKGFSFRDSVFAKNSMETKSISEKLYGHDFYIFLSYNDNMQFNSGTYQISGSNSELADIFESARSDLIAKYGDTFMINLSSRFDSIDEQLDFYRTEPGNIDPYQFETDLYWNVNDHTYIKLTMYAWDIEIEYKSVGSTSGTNMNENSLI